MMTEARNPQGEMFGEARPAALREKQAGAKAETLLATVDPAVRDSMVGGEPTDDLALLAVKRVQK